MVLLFILLSADFSLAVTLQLPCRTHHIGNRLVLVFAHCVFRLIVRGGFFFRRLQNGLDSLTMKYSYTLIFIITVFTFSFFSSSVHDQLVSSFHKLCLSYFSLYQAL